VTVAGRVGLLERLRARRRALNPQPTPKLPDPAKPPGNRGAWGEAALTNVDITEVVKRQIRTNTRPWEK
jgi:hypothetical protein